MPRGAGGPIRRGGRCAKKQPSESALRELDENLSVTMPQDVCAGSVLGCGETEWKHAVDLAAEYAEGHLSKEPPITVYGKKCVQRRNIGFFGTLAFSLSRFPFLTDTIGGEEVDGTFVGWTYNYSKGSCWTGLPIKSTPLKKLLDLVNEKIGAHFNAILVNQYVDPSKTRKPHGIGDHCELNFLPNVPF